MNINQKIKTNIKKIMSVLYWNLYYSKTNNNGCRVLMYHAFGSKLPHDTDSLGLSVTIGNFLDQAKFYLYDYKVIPFETIADPNNLIKNSLCLTMDDGYEDNICAAELLNELKLPFTIFVATDFVDKEYFLSKSQLKYLSTLSYCSIGAHGKTHTHLGKMSIEDQKNELSFSKKYLEDVISEPVETMSYPHGSFNANTPELVKKCGYKLAASSLCGINKPGNFEPFVVRRTEISSNDSLEIVKKKNLGYYDFLKYKQIASSIFH